MFNLYARLYLWSVSYRLATTIMSILTLLILIFAVIGVIATIKFFAGGKKRKETPGEYWMRTGKMK